MIRPVSWIQWTPENNVLAGYKKDCTFCTSPATKAACSHDGNFSMTIRTCGKPECRMNAAKLAAGDSSYLSVKACPKCGRDYDKVAWEKLQLVARIPEHPVEEGAPPSPMVQVRLCSGCGLDLTVAEPIV
jgi:hypothetical protein